METLKKAWNWLLGKTTIDEKIKETAAEIKKEVAEVKVAVAEAKVAVVPGLKQWFGDGAEGYIRMSFDTSEKILNEAISRIKNVIQ